MTKEEYDKALADFRDNKYAYVSGKKEIPKEVGQLLAAFYLWPYDCDYCNDGRYGGHSERLEGINSHVEADEASN